MSTESLAGHFLIANSALKDSNFDRSVVLVVEHDDEGAFGLIVNRPLSTTLDEAVEGLDDRASLTRLFEGGPVRKDTLFVLHRNGSAEERGEEVLPEVYLGGSRTLLEVLVDENELFHVYAGYAGWGAGQLESELKAKSWVTVPAGQELIFHRFPEKVWREALNYKGGIYSYFARTVRDPFLN